MKKRKEPARWTDVNATKEGEEKHREKSGGKPKVDNSSKIA